MTLTTEYHIYSINSINGLSCALVVTNEEVEKKDLNAFCDVVTSSMRWCSGTDEATVGNCRYFDIIRCCDEARLQELIASWGPPGPMVHGFRAEPIDIAGNIMRPLSRSEDKLHNGLLWRIAYAYGGSV